MSRAGLARLWSIIGALLALYAIGTWITLQGGKSFAELPGLEPRSPVTSAFEAVPIVGVLLGILSIVGLLHVHKVQGVHEALLPVVAVGDVGPHNVASWSMRVYQGFFLALFIVVPLAALYQLNSVVLQRGVLWHEGAPARNAVVLKNAFAVTRGSSADDVKENLAWRERPPNEGFTWLANTRCDVVKWSRTETPEADVKAQAASPTPAARPSEQARSTDVCKGANDYSEICEGAKRHCRGMQWLPVLSPALLVGPTLLGVISAMLLLLVSGWRKSRQVTSRRRSSARCRNQPTSPPERKPG